MRLRLFPLSREAELDGFASKANFPQMKRHNYHPEYNFLFVDSVVGGVIPAHFMPAVEAGLVDRIKRGVLAGFQIQDICVEVHYGKHHSVDSNEAAFRTAASLALKEVFAKAKPSLLEPVVTLNVTVPDAFVGDIYSDMSSRGGRILGSESFHTDLQTIDCEVALRAIAHYNRTLNSLTGGQGTYAMSFAHYEPVAAGTCKEIISLSAARPKDR